MKHITIETSRLILRPQSIAEVEALRKKERDPEMVKAYGDMIETMRALPGREEWGSEWCICLKDSGESVGGLCIKGLPDATGSIELGYGIDEEHRQKGYATEAVRGMSAWAAAQPGVARVTAQTEPGNAISQKVLAASGYVRDGFGDEGPLFRYTGQTKL